MRRWREKRRLLRDRIGLILLKRQVLRDVNGIRARFAMGPLRALPKALTGPGGSGHNCPLAVALRGPVGVAHCWPRYEGNEVELTPEMRRFVQAFDFGRFPELAA